MNFPIIKHYLDVYHFGKIDITEKNSDSLEGSGLSVSIYPKAWGKITRCWGILNKLIKKDSSFLDFHSLSKEQKDIMLQWGVENSYIEHKTLYKVEFFNGDFDTDQILIYTSIDEIVEEGYEVEDSEEFEGFIATEKLSIECLCSNTPPILSFDVLCTIYADKILGLDGVWWEDILDPSILSAPRGVIFNSKINDWQHKIIAEEDLPEEKY